MLITGLPVYHDGCYTVDDIAQLLIPFGFKHQDDNINVVPQLRMVQMFLQLFGNGDKVLFDPI